MNPDLASVCITFVRDETGDLVKYDDYARLKADFYQASDERADYAKDVAKLKAEVERLRNLGIKLDGYVDLLQAENERLRNAGDAVCESSYLLENDPSVIAWRAAKEGKQS